MSSSSSRWLAIPLAAWTFAAVLAAPIGIRRAIAHPLSQPGATATPIPTPAPTPADLIVDGRLLVLSGSHVFRDVIVRNGGCITISAYTGITTSGRLDLVAERIEVDGSSSINGDRAGYRGLPRSNGDGPGGGEGGGRTIDGGAGGGHGGKGGDGVMDDVPRPGARGGSPYGDADSPVVDRGSAGGAPGTADSSPDWAAGGHGGGAVTLVADTIQIAGTISVDGADGIVSEHDAAGGGAGGGVLVHARRLDQSGRIEASGGDGGVTDDGGGGGGGGRIKIYYQTGNVTRGTLAVGGGQGDGNGYANDGDPGTIHIEVLPPLATATPTPTATATPTATPVPAAGCVCGVVLRRVPAVVIADALAKPERYYGWMYPLDPGKPPSPANPPRTCLSLQNIALDYHLLWNKPEWRVGCP